MSVSRKQFALSKLSLEGAAPGREHVHFFAGEAGWNCDGTAMIGNGEVATAAGRKEWPAWEVKRQGTGRLIVVGTNSFLSYQTCSPQTRLAWKEVGLRSKPWGHEQCSLLPAEPSLQLLKLYFCFLF